jgi:hypothetical protein
MQTAAGLFMKGAQMEHIDPKKEATSQLLCGPGLGDINVVQASEVPDINVGDSNDFALPEPQPCTDEVCESCQ